MNHALDGGPDPRWERVIWGKMGAHSQVSAVRCAKKAEPIDLPFALWTPMDRRKYKFNRIRPVAPMCPHWRADLRHLANTIEPSVCGGDAVLRQITLHTCYGRPME